MKINGLIEKLDFPKKARVDRKIFKNVFFNNAILSKSQTDVFTSDIEAIRWIFALKEENTNISSFKKDDLDYSEIQVIGIELRSCKNNVRIAEVIHKNIQFPVILIFEFKDMVSLSIGIKRENKADKSKSVVEEIFNTDWTDCDSEKEKAFLNSLKVVNLFHQNFYEFYKDFADRVKFFIASIYRDYYHYENPNKTDEIYDMYIKIKGLEEKEKKLKGLIKSSDSISAKVRLNIEIKDIEKSKYLYISSINT